MSTVPQRPKPSHAATGRANARPAGIECAMILAAGLGTRMRPLSDSKPKPMIEVAGKPIIDHQLDRLADAGIGQCVVNLHYLAPLLEHHLGARRHPRIRFSREDKLLETGGGVAKALTLLGPEPFVVLNGDQLWLNGPTPMLERLARHWDGERMDALLLQHPIVAAHGYGGYGDYFMDSDGALRRRREEALSPFVHAGAQILHPRLFRSCPAGAFSLRLLYDRAEQAGRLFGMRHDGEWFHIGMPEILPLADEYFGGRRRHSHGV